MKRDAISAVIWLIACVALSTAAAGCGDPVADDYTYECATHNDCADGYICQICEGQTGRCIGTVEGGCEPGEVQLIISGSEVCRPACEQESQCPMPGTYCTNTSAEGTGYCSCQ